MKPDTAVRQALQRLTIADDAGAGAAPAGASGPDAARSGRTHRLRNLAVLVASCAAASALTGAYLKAGAALPAGTAIAIADPAIAAPRPAMLTVSGYVVARNKTTVSADTTGRLKMLLVKQGDYVRAGQVLARLDNTIDATRLQVMQTEVKTADVQLQRFRIEQRHAEAAHQRNLELRDSGMISAAALEASQAQLHLAINQLSSGALQVEQARLNERLYRTVYDNTFVRAPFPGVVLALNAQIGEIVSPLAATGFIRSGICTIADLTSQIIEFDVGEKYLSDLRVGQAAVATLDALPGVEMGARVTAIGSEVDRAKGTLRVQAAFDSLDPRVRPDMSIQIAIRKNGQAASPTQRQR
jgi:HlyD family secretion protein